MTKISIAKVRVNGGTQSRAAINPETVSDYSEAMADGAVFPPIVVFHDGSDYWLADGFHRYQAASQARIYEVDADIRQGSQRDAILYSVGANASHGLRRTNDDKRRAVMVLLNDPEWSKWPQTKIAETCGVSQATVSRIVASENPASYAENKTRTVTRNGTTYEQNTANIGSKSKPDQEQGTTPKPEENKAQAPVEQPLVTTPSEGDQEPETPDPYGYAKLTEEALLDTANGLRADLEDERARRKKAEAEAKALKSKVADLTASDTGKTIARLSKTIEHKSSELFREGEKLVAEKRKNYALNKRVEELQQMGIAL